MLLTITTTHSPATVLGYLLHKNPSQVQEFDIPWCLARGRRGPEGFTLGQYVNDRPYVASSFVSAAISRIFGTAMGGRCSGKPELAGLELPLESKLSAVPCRGGEELLRRLFEPLGYAVEARGYPLDERFPEWGESPFYSVALSRTCRLSELLAHLYVLIPVLDDDKHYWVGEDEVDKLLKHGEHWLASHPERDLVVKRYLRHRDHRFEWTRDEFCAWAEGIADRFGCTVRFLPIGPEDAEVGAPTRMAVFEGTGQEP